jgi:uncharacterized Zn-finger protein
MTGQSETESDSIDVKEEKNSLKINKLKVKNDLQYVCTFGDCDQVFKRLYRLQRHLRQHSGQVLNILYNLIIIIKIINYYYYNY